MIRRLALAASAAGLLAGAAAAQPYDGGPDPYGMPPGYTTAYEGPAAYDEPGPGYAPDYEGPAYYDERPDARAHEDPSAYDAPVPGPYGDDGGYGYDAYAGDRYADDRGYYNSGASGDGYAARTYASRSGSSYSSRSSSSSRSAYAGGSVHIDADGVSREGGYGYEIDTRYAPFAYQRRFYAYSVAEGRSEVTAWSRREEYAYLRRHRLDDLRLPTGFFMGGLTGGVEGEGPVMWSSGGGGYASAGATASAGARAGAFARARGGRRGHRGHGGCGC